MISFSWLALSVTFGATSPKGRGLGKEMKFAWTAKGSHFEERLPPRRGKMPHKRQKGESGFAKQRLRGRGRLRRTTMPHRYFTTEISDGTATLRGADAHHLARVMRARLGDTVILCDGNAVEYTATITGFGDECVEFRVEPGYPSAAEPGVEVTLLAGYPKQDKLEQIIKHGVELGAAHFIPFFSRYCVAAPKKEEQKNERYNRIAAEAAKQCGRGVLPDVALPLPNFGAVCRTFDQYDLVLFCYECGGAPLRQLLAETAPADGRKRKIAIVTGAEGGFAAEEAEMAAKAGARTVGLGPRILRCETAPLAVLASVMTLTGNLE